MAITGIHQGSLEGLIPDTYPNQGDRFADADAEPKPERLNGIEAMPLSRRAQDRVGYVALVVCNVLTHLMTRMLKEHRVPTIVRQQADKLQHFSLLLKDMELGFYTRLRQTNSFNWSTPAAPV
jgi:hypothetical protein